MGEHRGIFTSDRLQAYLAEEPSLQTEQLSDRIWTVSDGKVRSLFLAGDRGVIAFDTFGTPGRARAYRRAIETAIPGKAITTSIMPASLPTWRRMRRSLRTRSVRR